MHGISTVPEVKFTWMIISSDHEISLNIRYSGNGTTPPVSLSATAISNQKASEGYLNQTSMPSTIGASQVLNAGWSSPSSIVLTFTENRSLNDTDIVTIVASPFTSGCDPSYPDFSIRSPPPLLNCDQITQKNFIVLSPDPHGFDRDKDGIGCDE
jgi:micrococcal nuclease